MIVSKVGHSRSTSFTVYHLQPWHYSNIILGVIKYTTKQAVHMDTPLCVSPHNFVLLHPEDFRSAINLPYLKEGIIAPACSCCATSLCGHYHILTAGTDTAVGNNSISVRLYTENLHERNEYFLRDEMCHIYILFTRT